MTSKTKLTLVLIALICLFSGIMPEQGSFYSQCSQWGVMNAENALQGYVIGYVECNDDFKQWYVYNRVCVDLWTYSLQNITSKTDVKFSIQCLLSMPIG